MHPAACLSILSILFVLHVASSAVLPSTTSALSTPPSIPLGDFAEAGDSSHSHVSQHDAPNPLSKRTQLHCEVHNTPTYLIIDLLHLRVFRHHMREVLIQARKQIQRKSLEPSSGGGGGGDRALRPSELPFKVTAWGLQISATSDRQALTWRMLDETLQGVYQCVYVQQQYFELHAIITQKAGVTLDDVGVLRLAYLKPPGRDVAIG